MNRYSRIAMQPPTRESVASGIFGRALTKPLVPGVQSLFTRAEHGRQMTDVRDLLSQGPWVEDQLQGLNSFGLAGFSDTGPAATYTIFGGFAFRNSMSYDDFFSANGTPAQEGLDWTPPAASATLNATAGYTRLKQASDSGSNPAAESKFESLRSQTQLAVTTLDGLSDIGHAGQVITTGRGHAVEAQRVVQMKAIKALMGQWALVTVPKYTSPVSDTTDQPTNVQGGATDFPDQYVPSQSKSPAAFTTAGGSGLSPADLSAAIAAAAAPEPIYKNPLVIGGVVLALGVGTMLILRKKKS